MHSIVRVFAFDGFTVPDMGLASCNPHHFLRWPYIAAETLAVDGGDAIRTAPGFAKPGTKAFLVQIHGDVHVEVCNPAHDVAAHLGSPVFGYGSFLFNGSHEWWLSFLQTEQYSEMCKQARQQAFDAGAAGQRLGLIASPGGAIAGAQGHTVLSLSDLPQQSHGTMGDGEAA